MAFIEVENVVFSYEAEAEETESNQSKTVLKNLERFMVFSASI